LNQLTTFMNNVIANSKKIFELPEQTSGEKLVAVWNEESQRTEKYNFTELIGYINSINTRIVNFGTIDRDENEFTFNVGFEWIIQGIEYANTSAIVETIELAESGNNRIDIAVLNTSNNIVIVTGFETGGTAEQPLPPPNTILLKIFVVTDADITEVDPPAPTLTIIQEGGITVPNVGSITFDGATIEDLGDGNIKVTITGGSGSTPTLGEVLELGDRESQSALDGDTLIDLDGHTKLVTCELLTENTTFIVPSISGFNAAFPLMSVVAPEFKILNNSTFTITLEGDTDVTLIGDVLQIPKNSIAIIKALSSIGDYSVTYQLNAVGGGGAFIPLSGTTTGNPVTGDVEFSPDGVSLKQTFGGLEKEIRFSDDGAILFRVTNTDTSEENLFTISEGTLTISKRIEGQSDLSSLDPTNKLMYAQRQYVDNVANTKANVLDLQKLTTDTSLSGTSLQTIGITHNVVAGTYRFTLELFLSGLNTSNSNIQFGCLGTATVSSFSAMSTSQKGASFPAAIVIQRILTSSATIITGNIGGALGLVTLSGQITFSDSGTFIPSVAFSLAPSAGLAQIGTVSTLQLT